MPDFSLREALPENAAVVVELLRALALELGDAARFRSTAALIRRHGFGPRRLFHTTLGFDGDDPAGLVLYFPTFSTTRGTPGLYVQDLYITPAARGRGLGRQLLHDASQRAATAWGATHLTLTVHARNQPATAFYRRLGFVLRDNEVPTSLDGLDFAQLRDRP